MLCRRYADLYPLIAHDLPSCEEPTVVLALQLAGREFCNKTEVWAATLDPIDIVTDTLSYTLIWFEETHVKKVIKVEIDGEEIDPELYTFTPGNTLVLDECLTPAAGITDGLVVEVIFVPRLTTSEIADFIFERWAEALVAKAIAIEAMKPNKPWSSPTVAAAAAATYFEKVSEAMAQAATSYKSGCSGLEA
jgi:hypothetical protein